MVVPVHGQLKERAQRAIGFREVGTGRPRKKEPGKISISLGGVGIGGTPGGKHKAPHRPTKVVWGGGGYDGKQLSVVVLGEKRGGERTQQRGTQRESIKTM